MDHAAGVWLAAIDSLDDARIARYEGWLSATERARSFTRPARRRQFIAARALLRIAIGEVLGAAPSEVELGGQSGRAPWLIAPAVPMPGLSVSHSGHWVACAVSTTTALGLDIEVEDAGRDVGALAEHAFDAETCARLAALPARERVAAFYREWSGQEARIKLGAQAGACYALPHAGLAVEVCSADELSAVPRLAVVSL
ncbi:4-phosphopantetheinyl transferase [Massilia sp. METH4]|uniref:4'-phosphopantetheinyl transferase family protein n=1 Tax=Massilia sp. METH4 TaxID=3123041 RepID=UPI0030CF3195